MSIPWRKSKGAKKELTTVDLLPIAEVREDYIKRKDGVFVGVLRVAPVNVGLLSQDGIKRCMQAIQGAINGVQGRVQLLVSNQIIRMEEYRRYIEHLEQEATDDRFLERLEELKKRVSRGNVDTKIPAFFLAIEEASRTEDTAARRLRERLEQVRQLLQQGGIGSMRITREEQLRHAYEKLNPNSGMLEPGMNVADLAMVAPQHALDKNHYFIVDDHYYKCVTIMDYPRKMDHAGWLADIYAGTETDISITLTPTDKHGYMKTLSDSLKLIRARLAGKLDEYERVRLEQEFEDGRFMLQEMSGDNIAMFHSTVVLIVGASSYEAMMDRYKDLRTRLSSFGMRGAPVSWYGTAPLWYLLPVLQPSEVEKYERWNMGSNVVASMIPFNLPSYSESKGVPIGVNKRTGEYVIVDRHDRTRHPNGNMFIVGSSGSGKSFEMTVDIDREVTRGTQCIVIDPEREYSRFPYGQRIVFSLGSEFCSNPFHMRSAIVDTDFGQEDIVHLGRYLRMKMGTNLTFFLAIYPQMSSVQRAVLMQAQIQVYAKYGMTFESTELLEGQRFPTLGTLEEVLREEGSAEAQELLAVLDPYIHGAYASMFNGQTNWEIDDRLTVLDVHDLSEDIQAPTMDLLIKDVWEFIKTNRTRRRPINFYVDEVGLLAQENAVSTLKFLQQLGKRIRKYLGNLTVATQNAEDVFSDSIRKYGAGIVKNCRFRLLLQMTRDDARQMKQVVELSETEENLLVVTGDKVEGEQGKGILSIGNFKLEIQTFATGPELAVADPGRHATMYGP